MRTHKLKKLVAGLIAATMLLNAGATAVHAAESGDSIMESQDAQRIEDALSPEDATTIESRSQLKEKTLLNAPLRASQQIRTFGIQFVYGAENQGGKLVWTPKTPDSGHKFVFRVNYALSGIGENPADALHITIPKHILKNRNGSFADIAGVAVPSARQVADGEADKDIYLAWREEGDNIVIYNYKPISAADNGYVEVSYATSEPTYYYRDMEKSNDFHATISVNGMTQDSTNIPVYINTGAVIESIVKRYPTKYNEWQTWFGPKPSGADDYFYLVWDLETVISEDNTQPYDLKYVDAASSSTGTVEVVGFNYSGTDGFIPTNTITNQTMRGKRYDKVLTRYRKTQFNAVNDYTITNNIRAELTPVDRLDPVTKVSSQRVFNYFKNNFFPPTGWFWAEKGADALWRWYYDNENSEYHPFEHLGMRASEYSSYELDKLKEGKISYIPDLDYAVWSHGYQYWYTVSGSHNNPDDYGKVKVRHELTDDNVHFVNESRKLTSADFQIDTLAYEIILRGAYLDGEAGKFIETDVTPNNTDTVKIYAKFGTSTTWNLIATETLATGAIDTNSTYVSGTEKLGSMSTKLFLKDNCVGYRISLDTPYYYTKINSVPNMRLKNSSYVMNYIASRDDIQIVNEGCADFYTNAGTGIFHKDIHDSDFVRIIERNSYLSKRIKTATNVPKKRQYHIGWKIEQDENYTVGAGERKNITQKGGVFYDLMPKGSQINIASIAVETPEGYLPENAYTYTLEPDYKNSGRTLLKVTVNDIGEKYTLYYETIHSWDSLKDYGNNVYNPVAYETGNEDIADGFPDNGGDIRDKALFNDLDTATAAPRFIYAEEEYDIVAITAAAAGLTKKIKNAADQDWSYETTTTTNGTYQYRLRYANSNTTKARDLVLFDSLENYVTPGGDVSDFHGTPVGLDLDQITGKGVNPVVYISTIPNLDLESHHNLEDSTVWTRLTSVTRASLAPAKAIAIDMRKTVSGADYVLQEGDSLTAILYMKAPATAEAGGTSFYPWAYNNIYIEDTVIDSQGGEDHFFIHHDYTAVRFAVTASFMLHKTNASDRNEAVPGIKYRVFGRSDYNTDIDIIKTTSNTGLIRFDDIEKGIYTLSEYESTPDWLMDYTQHRLQVTAAGRLLIDGVDCTDLTWETADTPRVHGNLSLIKRRENQEDGINNTWFQLSGVSDYGNDILINNHVDNVGRLTFDNVEMGTYSLTETMANDQYVKNKTKWTVRIDEHGTASLLEPENAADRDRLYQVGRMDDYYLIYNEPRYWNISLRKIDADTINRPSANQIWLQGAKFTLSGVSDLGNNYNATATSNADGLVEFTNIEKGTYLLKEIEAPHNVDEYGKTGTGGTRNYLLDGHDYVLKVDAQGNATVTGLSLNELGDIKFPNSRALDKKITITKKWIDANPANRPTPVLHLSTMEPVHGRNTLRFNSNGGTFTDNRTTNDLIYSDPLIRLNSQKQEITEQVLLSGTYQEPTRKGYAFTGWYAEASCNTLVSTTGTDIAVSGTRNVYAGWRELTATFNPGPTFNNVFRSSTFQSKATFKKYTGSSLPTRKTRVSTSDSEVPIYMWNSGTTVYWYSEANKVYLNENASQMFYNGGSTLKTIDLTGISTEKTTNMKQMFSGNTGLTSIIGLNNFNTSKVTDMSGMFYNAMALTSLNVSSFNTSKVTDMSGMFYHANTLTSLNLSNFNTANVTNMSDMFYYCNKLTSLNISSFNTGKVTNMSGMFSECSSLTSLNVNHFNTSNVTTMASMFSYCNKLTTLNLSNWNTGKVTNMTSMFWMCSGLTSLNVTNFNTSNVTTMANMFLSCNKLTTLDLSKWNTAKVTNMTSMFDYASNLVNIYVSNRWNTSKVTSSTNMFLGCTKLPNYNANVTDKTKAHYNTGGYLKYKAYAAIQKQDVVDKAFAIMQTAHNKTTDVGQSIYNKASAAKNTIGNGINAAGEKVFDVAGSIKNGFAPMVSYAAEYHPVETTATVSAIRQPAGISGIRLNAQQTINHGNGNYEYISDNNLWVKNGDTWTYTFDVFDDQVKYFLTEETVSGYTADASSWTIVEGQKEATITNKVDTGNLSVQKKVVGTTTSEKFTFNITLSGITGDRVFGDVLFTNGKAVISLGSNETKTINGIPSGVSYTVTEIPDERFNVSYSNASGQIAANTTKAAVVTNTYIPSVTPPADAPVNITLKKTVTGHFETSEDYEVRVWFEGLEKNKEYAYGTGTNEKFAAQEDGTAVFNLNIKNGETKVFQNIPVGAKYQFTESAGEYISSYSITDTSGNGNIANSNNQNDRTNTALATGLETADANENVVVTFNNTVEKTQPLHIRKTVTSHSNSDHDAYYPISIRLTNLNPNGTYDTSIGRLVADGDGVIEKDTSISEAQGIDFYALPVGAVYEFTEGATNLQASYTVTAADPSAAVIVSAAGSNTTVKTAITTAAETINEDEDVTVTFINERRDAKLKVQKQVNSIHWSYGDVTSIFRISGTALDGTEHQWVQTLKYPANEFELTVPVGVYRVEEISTSRYYPVEVTAVAGNIIIDTANMFGTADLTDSSATVKFTNDFTQREELSYTNSVVNIVPKAE